MFLDSNAWPPSPDGFDPRPPPRARVTPRQERALIRIVGLLLLAMFLGPFAGSSVLAAIVVLVRSLVAMVG